MTFIRRLISYLMNNEQLVNKLAESRPMRRLAQLTVSLLHRSRLLDKNLTISNPKQFLEQLRQAAQALRKEMEQVKDNMKKDPPKK